MMQVVSECPRASLGWYSKCNLQKPISMSNYAIINLFTENAISYMKMDLKSEFFDFFQPICFWKAETKLVMNLLEFLRSEVI